MEINHNQILQYFSDNLSSVYSKAQKEAKGLKGRFEYAFTTFIFVSLALSVQFSPGFGTQWKWLLLSSWAILLIAGIAGGCRLMLMPEYMRLYGIKDYLSKRVKMGDLLLKHPTFIQSVELGLIIDPDTFEPNTMEGLTKGYAEDKSKLATCDAEFAKLERWLPIIFEVQMWGFLLSYALLSVFVSKNYLCN